MLHCFNYCRIKAKLNYVLISGNRRPSLSCFFRSALAIIFSDNPLESTFQF
uniref:Uncharacterized protein n=1 Tax=Macaca fascicularis TaxID=9541 RepID=Q9GMQ0_MACFA|nr:hypothetical protein [Macaca fascicularis]